MKKVRFSLSLKERRLILKHGYPFDDFEAVLNAQAENPESVEFELDEFWFQHLLGEIARSANHAKSESLENRLSELYEYLEYEESMHGLSRF